MIGGNTRLTIWRPNADGGLDAAGVAIQADIDGDGELDLSAPMTLVAFRLPAHIAESEPGRWDPTTNTRTTERRYRVRIAGHVEVLPGDLVIDNSGIFGEPFAVDAPAKLSRGAGGARTHLRLIQFSPAVS